MIEILTFLGVMLFICFLIPVFMAVVWLLTMTFLVIINWWTKKILKFLSLFKGGN